MAIYAENAAKKIKLSRHISALITKIFTTIVKLFAIVVVLAGVIVVQVFKPN